MDEYRINGLTIKENLLQLAENGNKKFTESLHPGIENVLGIRIPALRRLGDRKSTRLNSSHPTTSRMPSSA